MTATIEELITDPTATETTETGLLVPSQRQLPWAGLATGTADDGESLSSQQLLVKAGLDWDTEIRQMTRRLNDGTIVEHPWARETYRSTDEYPLGVVRGHYEPFSNRDAFAFGDSIAENGQGRWIHAGDYDKGVRIFMTMELADFTVLGEDPYRMFLFLRTSHDGGTGLNAWIVPFAVRCLNQMQLVNAQHQGSFTIQHTKNMAVRAEEAAETLRQVVEYSAEFKQLAEKLAATTVSDQKVRSVLNRLVPEGRARRDDIIADLKHNYLSSTTVEPYRGTAYGLLQAVTEYYDHVKRSYSDNARFRSIMLGEGAKARQMVLRDLAHLN
jgi:phage/plasmid-like protein (TIGR03299 family)